MGAGNSITLLLIGLAIYFAIAGIIVPFCKRVGISPVLGYLLCGILIGPYGIHSFTSELKWISSFTLTDTHLLHQVGELGIIALLFMIGLELTFRRLVELKKFVLGLGTAQIVLTATVIFAIALGFGNSLETSVLIGASLALSSTAIVMQTLEERHLINRLPGKVSFSVLLMQDLAVIPILVLLSVLSGNEEQNVPVAILTALLSAGAAVVIIYFFGKLFLRPLFSYLRLDQNPEWLTAITLFIVVGSAIVTDLSGLSAALGAFLAGLLIAETEYKHEIEMIFEPVKGLLLGVFFLSVGMMIDISAVLNNPYWLLASVLGVAAIKIAVMFPLAVAFGIQRGKAAEIAIILSQCGEFAFLILSLAMATSLIPAESAQFFLLVTALSMCFSPIISLLAPRARKMLTPKQGMTHQQEEVNTPDGGYVLIAGFGRIGKVLGSILEKQMIPYLAIDHHGDNVNKLRQMGYRIIYGDAKRIQLWRKLKADTARAVVITIDDPEAALNILKAIREEWPFLPVILRSKDTAAMEVLYDHGATYVVPEALESSLQLARHLLEKLGMGEDDAMDFIRHKRRQAILEHADVIEGRPA